MLRTQLAAKIVSLHTGCVTLATCSPSVDLWISCNTEVLVSQRVSTKMEGNDRTETLTPGSIAADRRRTHLHSFLLLSLPEMPKQTLLPAVQLSHVL